MTCHRVSDCPDWSEQSTKDDGHAQAYCNCTKPFHFKATYILDFQDFLLTVHIIINGMPHHMPTQLEQPLDKTEDWKELLSKKD